MIQHKTSLRSKIPSPFLAEITTQDSGLYTATLNVDALFTNIPLDKTIYIFVKKLFQNRETLVKEISKYDFRDFQGRWCCYAFPSRSNNGQDFPFTS